MFFQALPILMAIEDLLIAAWEGQPIETKPLEFVCKHYGKDLDRSRLTVQLVTMENLNESKDEYPEDVNKVTFIIQHISASSCKLLIPQVSHLSQ